MCSSDVRRSPYRIETAQVAAALIPETELPSYFLCPAQKEVPTEVILEV